MRLKKQNPSSNSANLALFTPDSDWTPPEIFPDLSSCKRIAIDLETKDPFLKEKGPGSFRMDGYPVGISVASEDFQGYYPFAHMLGGNIDKDTVVSYFQNLLKNPNFEVIMANASYDLEWLDFLGISVTGIVRDVQIAEALIDEESLIGYSLDALCKKYLKETKEETLLREAALAYGFDPKIELWKMPAKYVGPYAEADAAKTLKIFELQQRFIQRDNLQEIYDIESALTPLILLMRKIGVRVNVEGAEQLSKKLKQKEQQLQKQLDILCGKRINVWAGDQIAAIARKQDLHIPTTDKGNPSFEKDFLVHATSPLYKLVGDVRNVNRLRETYVDDLILKNHNAGRIHAQFHQIRRDDDGTRTGRFSSSNPNLQQVPARDKELATLIRALFIPEDGQLWAKLDYSQQEPRLLTHYGTVMKLQGASALKDEYINNKKADFYTLVAKAANLERKPAKDVTLGRCYGAGVDKVAADIGCTRDKAIEIIKQFDNANPFIKELSDMLMEAANRRGFIRTIRNRRRHFNFWEPVNTWDMKNEGKDTTPVSLEAAHVKWPNTNLKRAFTYKALNALIQGSAADMTKVAMLNIWTELKLVPLMQVHDELNYSVEGMARACMIQYRMENAIPEMKVPILADLSLGGTWK